MSKLDDLKPIADSVLKNIEVSAELKEKTLSRCKRENRLKLRLNLPTAAVGMAAVLTLIAFNPFTAGKDVPADMSSPEGVISPILAPAGGGTGDIYMPGPTKGPALGINPASPITDNPNGAVSSDGQIINPPAGGGSGAPQSVPGSAPAPGAGPIYRPGALEEAEKYLGADFRQPEYIPSGFALDLVQVPVDMSKEGMEITLGYRSDQQLYTIRMKRGASPYEYLKGNKEVDINGVKASLISGPLYAGKEAVSGVYTRMQWTYNDVVINLEGQITEEEAVKVARSIQ